MDDLAAWLASEGLEQYLAVFIDNDISIDLLAELDPEDLRELGLSLGHRKKFLKALRHQSAHTEETAPPIPSTTRPDTHSERRLLTLMFCDLVDSTAIGRQLGAEQMQDLLRDYQQLCVTSINHFGGYVARFLGDGILAYFGYPKAHELDAERAVRAALQLIDKLSQLDSNPKHSDINIRVRIGIATGQVVVGDIIGEGASSESAVVGDAANIAARIQSLAPINTVMVSSTTRKLCRAAFHFADHGAHTVKGLSDPIQVWRVAAEQEQISRFRATRSQVTDSIFGRNEELQVLKSRWQAAQQGEGHIVEIKGEAGIGKSHLLEAFLTSNNIEEADTVLFQCSPYHTGSVLQPVLDNLRREITSGGSPVNETSLNNTFNGIPAHQPESTHYFAKQLSVDTDRHHEFENELPQTLKQHAFTGWVDKILLRQSATVIIIEDSHWLDATSIELFTQLIHRTHDNRLLLVFTARPEFQSTWMNHRSLYTPIILNRMHNAHGRQIIKRIAEPIIIPEHLVDLILDKTDGVPLFVEELTKSILDNGVIEKNTSQLLSTTLDIPDTLHDLLMSRIDRDPSAKNILQIGSAIGRDFAFQILASVAMQEESELQRSIDAVVKSEVVFESGMLPASIYTFRHALIQDAAYQSLLEKNRRTLHAKIAEALELQAQQDASDELLAYHWSKAGNPDKAVTYWHNAARYATSIWSNSEAVRRYQHALDELAKIESTEKQQRLELQLILELGDALRATSGSSATETIATFNRATQLCRTVNDISLFVRAAYGEFTAYFTSAKLATARSVAETLLARAANANHITGIVAGHQAIGMHEFSTGNFDAARRQFHLALSHKDGFDNEFDIQYPVLSQNYLSWTMYLTGHQSDALSLADQAIAESENVSTYNRALAMANACYLHQFGGDLTALSALASELKTYSTDKGFPVWYAVAEFFDSWQNCQTDRSEAALDKLEKALEFWGEDEIEIPYFKSIVAETFLSTEKHAQALQLRQEARQLMNDTGEIWYQTWQDSL